MRRDHAALHVCAGRPMGELGRAAKSQPAPFYSLRSQRGLRSRQLRAAAAHSVPTSRRSCREKELALQKATGSWNAALSLRDKLDVSFFTPLDASVRYLRAYTAIAAPLMESFFRYLAWMQTFSEVTRDYARIPLLGRHRSRVKSSMQKSSANWDNWIWPPCPRSLHRRICRLHRPQ